MHPVGASSGCSLLETLPTEVRAVLLHPCIISCLKVGSQLSWPTYPDIFVLFDYKCILITGEIRFILPFHTKRIRTLLLLLLPNLTVQTSLKFGYINWREAIINVQAHHGWPVGHHFILHSSKEPLQFACLLSKSFKMIGIATVLPRIAHYRLNNPAVNLFYKWQQVWCWCSALKCGGEGKKRVNAMQKPPLFQFIHANTQIQAHKNHRVRKLQFPSIAVHIKVIQRNIQRHYASPVELYDTRPSHGAANFPIQWKQPQSPTFVSGWRKQMPLPWQVAEGRDDGHSCCRCSRNEKGIYDPECDHNEKDRRSVQPVCRRAARLESPFREAQGEGRPSRSQHGAVWKAPGGDGGNINEKAERERERAVWRSSDPPTEIKKK